MISHSGSGIPTFRTQTDYIAEAVHTYMLKLITNLPKKHETKIQGEGVSADKPVTRIGKDFNTHQNT